MVGPQEKKSGLDLSFGQKFMTLCWPTFSKVSSKMRINGDDVGAWTVVAVRHKVTVFITFKND